MTMMAWKPASPSKAAAEKVFGVPNWRKPPSVVCFFFQYMLSSEWGSLNGWKSLTDEEEHRPP